MGGQKVLSRKRFELFAQNIAKGEGAQRSSRESVLGPNPISGLAGRGILEPTIGVDYLNAVECLVDLLDSRSRIPKIVDVRRQRFALPYPNSVAVIKAEAADPGSDGSEPSSSAPGPTEVNDPAANPDRQSPYCRQARVPGGLPAPCQRRSSGPGWRRKVDNPLSA